MAQKNYLFTFCVLSSPQGCHCILEGIPPTICKERLGLLQLFPIIIFVKFKSAKQIKEQKDPFFLPERLTNRQAKELFESANKMEQEYKPHFDGKLLSVMEVSRPDFRGLSLGLDLVLVSRWHLVYGHWF